MVNPDLRELLPSWVVTLRSEHKAPNTVRSYRSNVAAFLDWCDQEAVPAKLDRRTMAAHMADLLDSGAEATTVKVRHGALRRYSAWLTDEGELERDDLLGVHPPRVPIKVVEPLSDDEIRRLLADCSTRKFVDLRDAAILRLAVETGLRANEIIGLQVEDVDIVAGTAIVRRAKGGSGRLVGFSPSAARAVDRYLRARRAHRRANTGQLFLGQKGQTFSYAGLAKQFRLRAERAGVPGFHLHRLRNTAAVRWLARGGSERGLMSLAGWKDLGMLRRYTAAVEGAQAVEEAQRLNLGEL